MSERAILIKKAIPIIVISWALSLLTTLAIVYNPPFVRIGDESVTDVKLASQAIPFASTHATDFKTTTETAQYVDMSGMSVNLSLNRKSHLLILFNVEAYASENEWIAIRALVGQDAAYPGEIYLTPNIYGSANESYLVDWAAYGYNFYQPSVGVGTYTIKIQWIISEGRGYVTDRTLTVIALPE